MEREELSGKSGRLCRVRLLYIPIPDRNLDTDTANLAVFLWGIL